MRRCKSIYRGKAGHTFATGWIFQSEREKALDKADMVHCIYILMQARDQYFRLPQIDFKANYF